MKSLILILAFFSASAFSQNPWINYTETDNWKYEVKAASFENTKDGGFILMRTTNKTNNQMSFYKISMKTSDCKKGLGKTTWQKLNGEILSEFDFVTDGGTIASNIAQVVCNLVLEQKSI